LGGTVRVVGLKIGKKDVLNTDPAADVDARVVEVKILLTPESSKKVAGLTYAKALVKILP
jgi:HlyD family secretion protein